MLFKSVPELESEVFLKGGLAAGTISNNIYNFEEVPVV